MEKVIFEIHKDLINAEAQEYFKKSAGITDESDKSKRMLKDANRIKNEIEESLKIKAVVSFFDNFEVHEDTLTIERVSFKCDPFSLLRQNTIMGVFLYLITAGDYHFEDRGILEQLYADIWGTSYLDAGRSVLKKILLKNYCNKTFQEVNPKKEAFEKATISDSFGPGFYGMNPKDVKKIF